MDAGGVAMGSVLTGEHAQQLLRLGGLSQYFEVVAPALGFFQKLSRRDFSREQHDPTSGNRVLHPQRNLNTIHVGKIDIAEQDVGCEIRSDGKRFRTVTSASYVIPVLLQDELERLKHHGFIFDDEDSD